MSTGIKLLEKVNDLDNKIQHMKYFHEGYRESILTHLYGANHVWEWLKIDVDRYSPGSARRISYEEGWKSAETDTKSHYTFCVLPSGKV